MNFKLTLEYDGTAYCGWQRQKSAPTIQAEIESKLATMTGENITLIGSGRTDAGVHALGQVANFRCDTRLTPEAFQNGLNRLLPGDIVVRECCRVDTGFHARFAASSKTYRYHILNRNLPSAIHRHYAWFIRKPLNLDAMQRAIPYLVGTHDFKAFEGAGSPRSHTIRTIINARLTPKEDGRLLFEITADGFLRFMVRNIVGTLVDVGREVLSPGALKNVLASRDRKNAGATAPPHGLFLVKVEYLPECPGLKVR